MSHSLSYGFCFLALVISLPDGFASIIFLCQVPHHGLVVLHDLVPLHDLLALHLPHALHLHSSHLFLHLAGEDLVLLRLPWLVNLFPTP